MLTSLRRHCLRAVVLAIPVVWAAQLRHGALTARHLIIEVALALPIAAVCLMIGARAGFLRFPATAAAMATAMVVASPMHALVMPEQVGHHDVAPHALQDTLPLIPIILVAAAVAWLRPSIRRHRRALGMGVAFATVASTLGGAPFAGAAVPAFSLPLKVPSVLTGSDITINMQQTDIEVFPGGPATTMWTYNGEFPGPTIRRPSGEQTRVTFVNNLPASVGSTTVHHHGNHSAPQHDGPPHDLLIPTGGSRTYVYDGIEDGEPERAATQWYHDHRMDVTGRNVYMGLAGMYILDDEVDAALPLPDGDQDVPLVFADRTFDGNNQLEYEFDPNGVQGNTQLVNGVPQPYFEVADRKYRFRLLNASNLRSYDFSFGNQGLTMTQIATEAGLLPVPITRTHLRLGPGERAEVVVDFAGRMGQDIVLRNNLAVPAMKQTMQFRVRRDEVETASIPPTLRPLPDFEPGLISMTRTWVLGAEVEPLVWTINGRAYDPHRIDTAPLNPKLNSTERWVFVNATTAEHVVHIHDVDWRILNRYGASGDDAETAMAEVGLKEMFYIRPGEVIEVASKFTDHVGDYVVHCHLLEHEDRAMMANFRVEAA